MKDWFIGNIKLYRVLMATRVFRGSRMRIQYQILEIGQTKMVNPRWRIKNSEILNHLNRVKLATRGSSGSLIANSIADFGNSSKFTIRHLGSAILE